MLFSCTLSDIVWAGRQSWDAQQETLHISSKSNQHVSRLPNIDFKHPYLWLPKRQQTILHQQGGSCRRRRPAICIPKKSLCVGHQLQVIGMAQPSRWHPHPVSWTTPSRRRPCRATQIHLDVVFFSTNSVKNFRRALFVYFNVNDTAVVLTLVSFQTLTVSPRKV